MKGNEGNTIKKDKSSEPEENALLREPETFKMEGKQRSGRAGIGGDCGGNHDVARQNHHRKTNEGDDEVNVNPTKKKEKKRNYRRKVVFAGEKY